MKYLKRFDESSNSNSITNIEVSDLVNDILIDLKDISEDFSWRIIFRSEIDGVKKTVDPELPPHNDKDFYWAELSIYCSDDVSKLNGWTEVLDRFFGILIDEGLKIYDQKESITEVKPGKINPNWTLSRIINPTTFEYVDVKWVKEFVIRKNPLELDKYFTVK